MSRIPILSNILDVLSGGKKFVEIESNNLKADHRGYDKALRVRGLKDNIGISTDRHKSTLIFHKKS
jgi:hypothetical protein